MDRMTASLINVVAEGVHYCLNDFNSANEMLTA